jgi:hypothetical protein
MADDPNALMNAMIAEGATRGQRLTMGALARLAGGQPQEESSRARLSRLLAASADARQAGDEIAVAVAENAIDKLIADTRAARAEQPRDDQGRFVGADQHADHSGEPLDFDGGVRGRQPRPSPGMVAPSSTQLMAAAFAASRQERLEREQEQTIISANI